jgi:hypothetical protein
MFANLHPKLVRDIPWGWKRKWTKEEGWVVVEPAGKIEMPELTEYFDWQRYEIDLPLGKDLAWRKQEGLTLGTRDFKSVFTTASRFLGMETLLLEEPDLSPIASTMLRWNEQLLTAVGELMRYFIIGDDWAIPAGPYVSVDIWRHWIKPHVENMVNLAHEHDLEVIVHSAGDISDLLDDLVTLEVDVINCQRLGRLELCGDNYKGVELWITDEEPRRYQRRI